MTQTKTASSVPSLKIPAIQYTVAMPQPATHLFQVTLRVDLEKLYPNSSNEGLLDLKMPVWTPGSYLIREYSKHLQDFEAYSEEDRPLLWRKVSKNHWQIETNKTTEVRVRYSIFANELTVRTNHLELSHGYFNGAALFFFILGREKEEIEIEIIPPKPEWKVTTSLPKASDRSNTFVAADFDTLVDSPFEIGTHRLSEFEVRGKSHQLAIWGRGNAEATTLIPEIKRIIEEEAKIFDGLPYDRYLFLLHLSGHGYGGLEHKNGCSLNYPRFSFKNKEKRDRFMQLVAHEFFHLWNVKRIRPKALEVFNYEVENYTPSLWFCEGTTSFYDLIIPYRAGIYNAKSLCQALSKEITQVLTAPGRKVQPVSESSWDAWIKLYRRDANSNNCQISYYLKGSVISLMLDLLIREKFQNQRSLDDVMVKMWERFGKEERGYSPEELQDIIESVAGEELGDFFAKYIHGTEELPLNRYLEPFGLYLKEERHNTPYAGWKVMGEKGKNTIEFVEVAGPAQLAGIDAGDELLAIDGFKVNADKLSDRLKDFHPGETIEVTVFHQDELRTCQLILSSSPPHNYKILPIKKPSAKQKENFLGWLGVELSSIV
ncbi:MAG: M61 family metallopeptidase [Okeania sp. SIO2H7]|nr:M61 family metallopeptidase [Okeania sp. SIO2H7]